MSNNLSLKLDEETDVQTSRTIRCKNCTYDVTTPASAIEPHEHTFRNPAGYSYHVLCFSSASGAVDIGEPTPEASWFPGYAWSFALCAQCQNHLGWWYSGPDRFAGLIATRLLR